MQTTHDISVDLTLIYAKAGGREGPWRKMLSQQFSDGQPLPAPLQQPLMESSVSVTSGFGLFQSHITSALPRRHESQNCDS